MNPEKTVKLLHDFVGLPHDGARPLPCRGKSFMKPNICTLGRINQALRVTKIFFPIDLKFSKK
jgi:hypothetical protein